MRFLGYETERSAEFEESSPSSCRLQGFAALKVSVGGERKKNKNSVSNVQAHTHLPMQLYQLFLLRISVEMVSVGGTVIP